MLALHCFAYSLIVFLSCGKDEPTEPTVTIEDINPENLLNPYDGYGKIVHDALVTTNLTQIMGQTGFSDSTAIEAHLDVATTYFNTTSGFIIDTVIPPSQIELDFMFQNTKLLSLGTPNDLTALKNYIDKTIETENIVLNSDDLVFQQKDRVLAGLSSMKYAAYFLASNEFYLNGDVSQGRQPNWCERWDDCMRKCWEEKLDGLIGWIDFVTGCGTEAGPGGSVLLKTLHCIGEASKR